MEEETNIRRTKACLSLQGNTGSIIDDSYKNHCLLHIDIGNINGNFELEVYREDKDDFLNDIKWSKAIYNDGEKNVEYNKGVLNIHFDLEQLEVLHTFIGGLLIDKS